MLRIAKLMVVVALSLRAGVLPAQVPELPGTLDASFDVLRGPDGLVHVLAEDSEGWIYVGGEFSGYGSRNVAYLARIDADGALDSEFDLDLNGPVYALRVLPNDDLLVAGDFTSAGGKSVGRLVRVQSDGEVADDYAEELTIDGPVRAMERLDDGRLYIGGEFDNVNEAPLTRIARLDATGQPDLTFSPTEAPNGAVFALLADSDDRLILGGAFQSIGEVEAAVIARMDATGEVDTSFTSQIGAFFGRRDVAHRFLELSDGRLLVLGDFRANLNREIWNGALRLFPDGRIDREFRTNQSGSYFDGALEEDGSILVAGDFLWTRPVSKSGYARFEKDGALDLGFSPLWGYLEAAEGPNSYCSLDA